MTLGQKLTLLDGSAEVANSSDQYQAGYLPGIPSLGIPSLKLTDGPPGVITRQDSTGMTATMGVAATFSQSDARLNGVVIGRDARALGMDVTLEPFINMDRDTSWARGFNTFGEDPLLTGQTGAAEIEGIQSQGVMAMAKHFVAYDGANAVNVSSQALHEIYLQPFADAVKAGVAAIMCSYAFVNNNWSCANSTLLTKDLRNEMGFKGFVTSDWGASHSTSDLAAGDDLEMPGSGGPVPGGLPAYYSRPGVLAALANGSLQMSTVNTAVGHILYEMDRFGLLSGHSKHTVTPEDTAGDESVVRKTAQDAATLLKNDGSALPLSRSALANLALIGPGAGQTIATNSGGEAAGGLNAQQPSALATLEQDTAGTGAKITYAVGDDLSGVPVPASALSHNGQPGLQMSSASGARQVASQLDFTTSNANALPAGAKETWAGTLTVPSAGSYWLNIQALGATAALTVDGKQLADVGAGFGPSPRYGVVHWTDGNAPTGTPDGLANDRVLVKLTAGGHKLQVTDTPDVSGRPVQVRLNWVTPSQQQANDAAAVAAAKSANTAVVFAWDTGSGDLSTPLPDQQDQLIQQIASVNPNTIVVLQSGQPIAMPWLSKVKAVLEAWYGGDQAGVATAQVLLGKVDPGGRLPFTWPKTLSQEVAHQAAHPERTSIGVLPDGKTCPPGSGGRFGSSTPPSCTTTYSEGIDIGYRFYDATHETPLYAFGYGLSYTTFGYSGLKVSRTSSGGLNVRFRLRNTGSVTGSAVPQVYLGAPAKPPEGAQFAPKALAAYGRIQLAPGQTTTVTLHVPLRQLQYWSDTAGWVTATGRRGVYVGSSERAMQLASTVSISS
jgi:beta-glucosidase